MSSEENERISKIKITRVASATGREATTPEGLTDTSSPIATIRAPFLDNLRYLMILSVIVYHACGAYASVAPHWVVHDATFLAADIIRELFDVFMMPLLFFMAALGLSYAISRWVLARHSRAFVMILRALFLFCLVVRP